MMTDRELEDYLKERDRIVSTGSLDEFITWAEGRGYKFFSSATAEITLHKMRTAIETLPHDMRRTSDIWLRERGFQSWLDYGGSIDNS